MIVEVCATSVQSVMNAEKAGASRVELCSELAVGGITPSYGLIQEVIRQTKIPVYVLIRPRSGDFTYSDSEFKAMKSDIEICKKLGCAGIVSGVLNEKNEIDKVRTLELINCSKPLSFSFHRAFDWLENQEEGLKILIELGVDRILTSGGEPNAELGLQNLIELKNQAKGDIVILPGGGINPENVHLFKNNGFSEVHASASVEYKSIKVPEISMNSSKFFDETKLYVSDLEKIKQIVEA